MKIRIILHTDYHYGEIGTLTLKENDVYYVALHDGVFAFLSGHIEIMD